jgi:hypothetical protein
MSLPQGRRLAPSLAALSVAFTLGLAACGGGDPTATPPPPTLAATVAPATARPATATSVPTRPSASGTATATRPTSGTPGTPANATPNPVAVTAAYSNLQKQSSYHLEIRAEGIGTLVPLGIGNTLVYTIDANGGNQKIEIDDGSGTKQEGYKVGSKYYLVTNGVAAEQTSLPLIFTLPDLLYNSLTAPGVMTFTSAGSEQVNGRQTTKYNGSGQVARLAANPIFALALPNAQGDVSGPLWVDTAGNFLVAGDLTINLTAPQPGTARLRLDVTQIGQVAPITAPH